MCLFTLIPTAPPQSPHYQPPSHLFHLPLGYGCSFRSQWRSLSPSSGGAAQDGRRAGLQRNGRQGAKFSYIHLSHHSWRRGWKTWWPKARRSAFVCQWCGRCTQACYLMPWGKKKKKMNKFQISFSAACFSFNPAAKNSVLKLIWGDLFRRTFEVKMLWTSWGNSYRKIHHWGNLFNTRLCACLST